jgi:predicted phosphodiesterase
MRVAALYDIHGNLPALEAVLEDVARAEVDRIVVGGDLLPGPMARETFELLLRLDTPAQFIYGNGELMVLAQIAARHSGHVTYWGTTTGQPLPEPLQEVARWTGRQLDVKHEQMIRSWPGTLELEVPGVGHVLFCHGTPRSELEVFTRLTPEDRLLPVFEGLAGTLVVCGHTHMQFERTVGRTRVVNAGSVGMPFGEPSAYWLLLGDGVQLRKTSYDLLAAADRVRATQYPQAEEFAARSILQPPSEDEMLRAFTDVSFR